MGYSSLNHCDTVWPAPAKVNLFLHITARRPDGYHNLQTLFHFLDFGDSLHFSPRQDGKIIRSSVIEGVSPEQDLMVRAARSLQSYSACKQGVDIAIEKRIPMGGGLGGGSSDAATVLVALNHLWGLGLSAETLARLGLELGADVPVFVKGQAAWAEGVGEKLTPLALEPCWYVVLCPGVSVPTAELFSSAELTRDCQAITIRDYLEGVGSGVRNVFEPLVVRHFPEVARALQTLSEISGVQARMSGTGSTVFVKIKHEKKADEVLAQLPQHWRSFKAKGLNQSPLHSKWLNLKDLI